MSNSRSFLLIALLLVGFLLWQSWQQDYATSQPGSTPASTNTAVAVAPTSINAEVPSAPAATATSALSKEAKTPAINPESTQVVEVITDLLHLMIDTRGGAIVRADLLAYPVDPKDKSQAVRLLDDDPAHFFVAQTGLVSDNLAAPNHLAQFSAQKTVYTLVDGNDKLEVPLTWQDASGIKVTKVYTFKRDSYLIETREEITNASDIPWSGNEYRQLQRVPPVIVSGGFSFNNPERYAFAGAAWYSPQEKFEKRAFAKFADQPLDRAISNGWAAMLQHYFFAAWIPASDETDHYSTAIVTTSAAPRYLIRVLSPTVTVAPGETKTLGAKLYIGPKLQSTLDNVAPGLSLTVDYGIFTVIAAPLHWMLSKLQELTGNWGFAIIFLVLLIKLALFKLSEAQYRSMAKMKRLQPRMQALKERYGDDKQKLNAAMMELYQKEKINPLGGCLPTLVQIPVFIALYWVLLESVELRQAPFIGWIQNLSAPDPYFVLPVLNGAAMIAAQWLSPNPGVDPMQAKMMKAMPIMFAVMFAFFPAGLVLYWTVNGSLSLLQQWVITKRFQAGEKAR